MLVRHWMAAWSQRQKLCWQRSASPQLASMAEQLESRSRGSVCLQGAAFL